MASRWSAAHFNRPDFEMFDFDTYALCGDGCMMEGVAAEAASLAGHQQLSNLCWIYDNNKITIEGHTDLAFTEDVATRFIAYGWNVTRVGDANDLAMLGRAFQTFRNESERPTLIIVDSHIAYGSPNKQDTSAGHGEPLGEEEIRLTKRNYGWPEDSSFLVPEEVRGHFAEGIGRRGADAHAQWQERLEGYRKAHPALAAELEAMQRRELPEGWDRGLDAFEADPKGLAGRAASSQVLNEIARDTPWLIGGSADLAPSTKTRLEFDGAGEFSPDEPGGRNFHFGVREHAMTSILNGLSLSKIRPYGSGFLIFSDYARPAIRLSALMDLPVIHVFTHDSIGVGEDGPTHQPVEQLASLRAIPGLTVLRPCDANEVVEAWRTILQLRHEPVALILTRQNLPTLDRSRYAPASGLVRGGYVISDAEDGDPDVILIATGSEVPLCLDAQEKLAGMGKQARVVSLPSWEIFDRQDAAYRESVLPAQVTARVAVEQASSFGWERYAGSEGAVVAMDTFGASAPLAHLQEKFGFTPDRIADAALEQIRKHDRFGENG